ncbi:hypothetical protein MHBO_002859 [Bonamia ostreae]|uniref:Mitogen-activated protein kinase n=1 Tax=Bonamia ostreae TaxID=126728 RepID=A0ABV2ANS6_9EUKA
MESKSTSPQKPNEDPNTPAPVVPKKESKNHFPKESLGSEYEFVSYIGSGSYGHVCKAKQVQSGKMVAIKKFSGVFKSSTNTLRLLRELRILRALRSHPRIIKLIDIIPPKNLISFNDLYIVLEYMDTDLSRIIHSNQYLSRTHVQYILYQILLATKGLHSAQIYHRDLKPQNILINENCTVKLCDFGLSRGAPTSKNSETRRLTSHVVTRWYRAPEVIFLTSEYTSSIDIWSIGCIFAELLGMLRENMVMVKGRMPLFPGISCFPLSPRRTDMSENSFFLDQISLILHVIGTPTSIELSDFNHCVAKNYLNSLPYWPGIDLKKKFPASNDLEIDLLRKMLRFSPSQRLTVEEALSHPYLKKVREIKHETNFEPVEFEFEGLSMSKHGRGLLMREILKYNRGIRESISIGLAVKPGNKNGEFKNGQFASSKSVSIPKSGKSNQKEEKALKKDFLKDKFEMDSLKSKNVKSSGKEYRRRTSIDKKEIN